MAVAGFACTYGITKVALCAPGVIYKPFYYFSRCCSRPRVKIYFGHLTIRYPQPVSSWLNLVMLMTPTSWAWTLASLATVALCFHVGSIVISRWMGMRLENIEIDLCPFRYISFNTIIIIFIALNDAFCIFGS